MRRLTLLFALTAVFTLFATQIADACGDKFLLIGRGIKFQRGYAATYRANILLYSGTTSTRSVMRDAKFHEALRTAGHIVTVVQSADSVKSSFKAGTYDVVLTEFGQIEALGIETDIASSRSLLLPVVQDKLTKGEKETCKRLFPTCGLQSDGKAPKFLEVIDKQMEARAKAEKAQKAPQKD